MKPRAPNSDQTVSQGVLFRYCLRLVRGISPTKYGMFKQFKDIDFSVEPARENGKFTNFGNALNAAWKQAYDQDPVELSDLQDAWGYSEYYMPAQSCVESRGIHIQDRADCVKGLCWSLCNLFGPGGWRKSVTGSGVNDSMSDAELVAILCHYVMDNVLSYSYAYATSYQNRYANELSICLDYLGVPDDVDPRDWYYSRGCFSFVANSGLMVGDDRGLFNPYKKVSRAEFVTILYRYDQGKTQETTYNQVISGYSDVLKGSWYAAAVKWASEAGRRGDRSRKSR